MTKKHRRSDPRRHKLMCQECGGTFYASRSHATTCSITCRKRRQRCPRI